MNPKQFLLIGGVVLILIGVLGFVGVIGPGKDGLFKDWWWFDNAENWAHTVLGVVALVAAFVMPASLQRPLVVLVGVVGVLVGLYSALYPGDFLSTGANLENPADTALHIVVGAWALLASLRKSEEPTMPGMSPM